MAIELPQDSALGAKVNQFPLKQYTKIKEIIDTINSIFSGTAITTDTVSESTSGAGVTVDGMLIIDNSISNASSITSSGAVTGGYFKDGVQTLSGPGAISVIKGRTEVTSTGVDALTLAAGTDGMKKAIYMVVDGGDATITPTGLLGYTTIKFTAVGQGVELVYSSSQSKWVVVGNNGATLA